MIGTLYIRRCDTKKLLAILLFALAIVSSVTAAPVWELSYDTGTITVSVTNAPQWATYLTLSADSNGIISNSEAGPDAPPDSYTDNGTLWVMIDNSSPYTYNDGIWLTADFAFAPGKISSVVSLYEYVEAEAAFYVRDSIVVPEPGTIALFCLGGLMLRRRK